MILARLSERLIVFSTALRFCLSPDGETRPFLPSDRPSLRENRALMARFPRFPAHVPPVNRTRAISLVSPSGCLVA